MKTIARLIGINKHQDKDIPDLAGAARDAKALWALFQDSVENIDAKLILDHEATRAAIFDGFINVLADANEDEVVILGFSGHGTRSHELVACDTSTADFQNTTLSMETLVEGINSSRANTVICILDCCFSGGAPAKVLENSPRKKLSQVGEIIKGKGKVIIAASKLDEPAYEHPSLRHGLLTFALMEQWLKLDSEGSILSLLDAVLDRVRALAAQFGVVQTPGTLNHIEGGMKLTRLIKGNTFYEAFPEISTKPISKKIGDLSMFGIAEAILNTWTEEYSNGLNELQIQAVNYHRLLENASLLVVAPTSSGKTFLGEMAAIKAISDGRKAVFLFPYKALVNEKYERFQSIYGSELGIRVVRCTGDYTDTTREFILSKYEIAVLTYEMFLSMVIGNPQILHRIGLIVLDEAQFIIDKTRGIVVELILTRIRMGREQGIEPQLLALSATIGGVNHFDEWLNIQSLIFKKRPVPLEIGVLDRRGIFQYLDTEGEKREVQLLPSGSIIQRRNKPSAQDVIVPLVRQLIQTEDRKENVIVFRNQRGSAQGSANYLSEELELPAAENVIAQLPELDQSSSSQALRQTLQGGVAFHNTNLSREERNIIEKAFRDKNGSVRVITATSTIAAGINTPASTVIIVENSFPWANQPYSIADVHNMAGRAGRLGYNEIGRAIILAESPYEQKQLFEKYVFSQPEPIQSSFESNQLATWLIRLLSQMKNIREPEIPALVANTYGGYLDTLENPNWGANIRSNLESILAQFLRLKLIEKTGESIRLSILGRACGRSSFTIESALQLIENLQDFSNERLSPISFLSLVQALPELDSQYTPLFKRGERDAQWPGFLSSIFGSSIAYALQKGAHDHWEYYGRAKRALILVDWIEGLPTEQLENKYTMNPFNAVGAGDIRGIADTTRFHLKSAYEIAIIVLLEKAPDAEEMENLFKQLEIGIPGTGLKLIEIPIQLSRGECLALLNAGITTPEQFWSLDNSALEGIFSSSRLELIEQHRKLLKLVNA